MDKNRLFIAIEIPSSIKELALAHQELIKSSYKTPVKWVKPENMHLTLKFLGNVKSDTMQKIYVCMESAVENIAPFQIETGNIGAFPSVYKPRIIWLGIKLFSDDLQSMQKRLDSCLKKHRFPTEKRKLTPHLTLGRIRAGRAKSLTEYTSLELQNRIRVLINKITLFQSILTSTGPVYKTLKTVQFTGIHT